MNLHAELQRDGFGRLPPEQVEAVRLLHRQFGLALTLARTGERVTLNDDAGAMVTELLRLADLGATAEAAARHPAARETRVDELVHGAATSWAGRIR
jgi:hypothetical protein